MRKHEVDDCNIRPKISCADLKSLNLIGHSKCEFLSFH